MDAPVTRRRRKPKAPLSLWIVENREAQPSEDGKGWPSDELAVRLGVRPSTVRGWESGRSVSEDNIRAMERLFGTEAPGRDAPSGDQAALIAALTRQSEAIESLVASQSAMTTEIRFAALSVLGSQEGSATLLADLVRLAAAGKLDELAPLLRPEPEP